MVEHRVPPHLARGSTVTDLTGDLTMRPQVWADHIAEVLDKLDLHTARAHQLRTHLTERYTWQGAAAELRAAIQALRDGR